MLYIQDVELIQLLEQYGCPCLHLLELVSVKGIQDLAGDVVVSKKADQFITQRRIPELGS